jgi:hypothetical protein
VLTTTRCYFERGEKAAVSSPHAESRCLCAARFGMTRMTGIGMTEPIGLILEFADAVPVAASGFGRVFDCFHQDAA